MKQKEQTLNRGEIAREMKVTPSSIDDWVVRGCPCERRGLRGIPSAFSLEAVREWRVRDLANRRNTAINHGQRLDDPALHGREHLNVVRDMVEDSARHFLWFAFTRGTDAMIGDLTDHGMGRETAERTVGASYIFFLHLYELWLTGDEYSKAAGESQNLDLDGIARCFQPAYNGKSAPPSKFDLDDNLQLPKPIERLLNQHRANRLKKRRARAT
jgi:hypothetical protein